MRMTLQTHYYQPIWTLVGGGLKDQEQSGRPMASVLPKKATWIKDSVATFDPDNNKVTTAGGDEIAYEFLVVAMGLQLRYESVKVGSAYLPYAKNVFQVRSSNELSFIPNHMLRDLWTRSRSLDRVCAPTTPTSTWARRGGPSRTSGPATPSSPSPTLRSSAPAPLRRSCTSPSST